MKFSLLLLSLVSQVSVAADSLPVWFICTDSNTKEEISFTVPNLAGISTFEQNNQQLQAKVSSLRGPGDFANVYYETLVILRTGYVFKPIELSKGFTGHHYMLRGRLAGDRFKMSVTHRPDYQAYNERVIDCETKTFVRRD